MLEGSKHTMKTAHRGPITHSLSRCYLMTEKQNYSLGGRRHLGGNITFPSKINRWNLQEDEGEQGHVGTFMTPVAVFKRIALFHHGLRPREMEPSMAG